MTDLGGDRALETLPSLLKAFGARERRLLEALLELLPKLSERKRTEIERVLAHAAESIPHLARALEASPVVEREEELGGRRRGVESLLEMLCAREWLPSNLTIPTGALVGRALSIARLNFLKALRYIVTAPGGEEDEALLRDLAARLEESIEDAIFAELAEDLLTATTANPHNPPDIRRAAARRLLSLWEDRLERPVAEFPSVLLSAWKARSKVRAIYGTLFGSEEVLSLLREACEERFVAFFTREQVTIDQMEAFREFLFGLPYEDILRIQHYMKEKGLPVISPAQVRKILGPAWPQPPQNERPTAEDMLVSYNRRRIRAEYRALSGSPGPHKTAEGYLMEALLREEIEADASNGSRAAE